MMFYTRLPQLKGYGLPFPMMFDDTLSQLEKMNKLLYWLRETGVKFQELIDYVNTLNQSIEDMDERLQQEIANLQQQFDDFTQQITETILPENLKEILLEWKDSGELADIINATLLNDKVDKSEVGLFLEDYRDLATDDDWSYPLTLALGTGAKKIYLPKEDIVLSIDSVYNEALNGIHIIGDGKHFVKKKNDSNYIFRLRGSIGAEYVITSDVAPFSNMIQISPLDAQQIPSQTNLLIKGQRDCLTYADDPNWFVGYATPGVQGLYYGEYNKVKNVNLESGVLTLEGGTIFPNYHAQKTTETAPSTRNTTTVQKVDFVKDIVFENIKFKVDVGTAISVYLGQNIQVKNCEMVLDTSLYTDGMVQFVDFRSCVDSVAIDCKYSQTGYASPTQHHYINVYKAVSSQNCGFIRCKAERGTQPFDFSYTAGMVPCIDCYVIDSEVKNASQSGMTSHGGTYRTRFVNNRIIGVNQGISNRSRNALITDNFLLGNADHSNILRSGILLYEGGAVDCIISNNVIQSFYNGVLVADASDLGETFRHVGALIEGNTIKACLNGIGNHKNSSTLTFPQSVQVKGNMVDTQAITGAMGIRLAKGTQFWTFEGNTFIGNKNDATSRALFAQWDCNRIFFKGNIVSGYSTALFIRGRQDLFTEVYYSETGNMWYNVDTQVSEGTLAKRFDTEWFKHVQFKNMSSHADAPNNTIYQYVDGRLAFKDETGTTHYLTTDTP